MNTPVWIRLGIVALMLVSLTLGYRAKRKGDTAGTIYWCVVWLGGMLVALDMTS